MPQLFRAGCFVVCVLAGCTGDADKSKSSTSTAQPINLSTDSAGLVTKPTSFGTQIDFAGHYETAVIARRNADGSVSIQCHDDQQSADAFAQGQGADTRLEVK
jgi:hypothetical protein